MILHLFSGEGWQDWGLEGQPMIRERMPILIDEDLTFEDAAGPRPAEVMNRWLRELPISGAPAPKTWTETAISMWWPLASIFSGARWSFPA